MFFQDYHSFFGNVKIKIKKATEEIKKLKNIELFNITISFKEEIAKKIDNVKKSMDEYVISENEVNELKSILDCWIETENPWAPKEIDDENFVYVGSYIIKTQIA